MSEENKTNEEKPAIRLCRKDENGKLVAVGALWLKVAKPDAKVKTFYVGNFAGEDIVAFDA